MRFDESTFLFLTTASHVPISTLELSSFLDDGLPLVASTPNASSPATQLTPYQPTILQRPALPCGLCLSTTPMFPSPVSGHTNNPTASSPSSDNDGSPPSSTVQSAPTDSVSTHPMQTHSKSGLIMTEHTPDFLSLVLHALHVALLSDIPHKGYKSTAKHPHWMAAMCDEMEALIQNRTRTLVPRPHSSNVVGSK